MRAPRFRIPDQRIEQIEDPILVGGRQRGGDAATGRARHTTFERAELDTQPLD